LQSKLIMTAHVHDRKVHGMGCYELRGQLQYMSKTHGGGGVTGLKNDVSVMSSTVM
jgi:hypothetical protein